MVSDFEVHRGGRRQEALYAWIEHLDREELGAGAQTYAAAPAR
jgi:hypothetical protein